MGVCNQLSMRQVIGGDMHVNQSLWLLKLGDPSDDTTGWISRNDAADASSLTTCPNATLSCLQVPVDVTHCTVCTTSNAFGITTPGDWDRPNGLAAWLIDSLPFPHLRVATSNSSLVQSFVTSPFKLPVKFDNFENDPALSVPEDVSIWVYMEGGDDAAHRQRMISTCRGSFSPLPVSVVVSPVPFRCGACPCWCSCYCQLFR